MNIIEELEAKISEIKAKIESIQNACSHPDDALDKMHGCTSDGHSDSYWTKLHCRLCHRKWTVDGSV